MVKMLIAYYSRTKHTYHMAEAVAAGARQVHDVEVAVLPIGQIEARLLMQYDAIIMGSPTYYGTMAAEVKQLFDESCAFHGQLAGKVGGAFSSSANIGGGNETTVLDILKAMLIHGMVIPGCHTGDHYGPVSVGDMDRRSEAQCVTLGKTCAELAVRLRK
jgi:NAD(P)H dehydrogenase (quinone)